MIKSKQFINTADKLPEPNKYVLGIHNRDTWHDRDDYEHVNYVVVKFVPGLSMADREKMKSGELPDPFSEVVKRSSEIKSADQYGNNLKPYFWDTFGPGSFNGQEIEWWMPLPEK